MEKRLKTPVFLLFAELLGYKSELVTYAEQWCFGNLPSEQVQRIMRIDAVNIDKVMHEDYGDDELSEWLDVYWDVVLSKYDEELNTYLNKKVPS